MDVRNMGRRLAYTKYPTCGQTAPWEVAENTPGQWVGGRVGANLGAIW